MINVENCQNLFSQRQQFLTHIMPRLFAKSMLQRPIRGYTCQPECYRVASRVGLEEPVGTVS